MLQGTGGQDYDTGSSDGDDDGGLDGLDGGQGVWEDEQNYANNNNGNNRYDKWGGQKISDRRYNDPTPPPMDQWAGVTGDDSTNSGHSSHVSNPLDGNFQPPPPPPKAVISTRSPTNSWKTATRISAKDLMNPSAAASPSTRSNVNAVDKDPIGAVEAPTQNSNDLPVLEVTTDPPVTSSINASPAVPHILASSTGSKGALVSGKYAFGDDSDDDDEDGASGTSNPNHPLANANHTTHTTEEDCYEPSAGSSMHSPTWTNDVPVSPHHASSIIESALPHQAAHLVSPKDAAGHAGSVADVPQGLHVHIDQGQGYGDAPMVADGGFHTVGGSVADDVSPVYQAPHTHTHTSTASHTQYTYAPNAPAYSTLRPTQVELQMQPLTLPTLTQPTTTNAQAEATQHLLQLQQQLHLSQVENQLLKEANQRILASQQQEHQSFKTDIFSLTLINTRLKTECEELSSVVSKLKTKLVTSEAELAGMTCTYCMCSTVLCMDYVLDV